MTGFDKSNRMHMKKQIQMMFSIRKKIMNQLFTRGHQWFVSPKQAKGMYPSELAL